MGLGQNWASAGQTKGIEILHYVNDEHLIGLLHHCPTWAGAISQDPSWPLSKCSQDGSGPKLGLSLTHQGHTHLALAK